LDLGVVLSFYKGRDKEVKGQGHLRGILTISPSRLHFLFCAKSMSNYRFCSSLMFNRIP